MLLPSTYTFFSFLFLPGDGVCDFQREAGKVTLALEQSTSAGVMENPTQPVAVMENSTQPLKNPTQLSKKATQSTQIPKVKKSPTTVSKQFDISCTVSEGTFDIDTSLLQNMQHFIEKECVSRLCSIERGGTLQRLHFQAIFKILSTSTIAVNKLVKVYLGWDKGEAPSGSYVLMKRLSGVGLHTYVGMLGYYIKDKGEDHFEVVHNNITHEDLTIGLEEYVKFDTPFAKNKVVLTSKNLLERCLCYLQYRMKSQLGSTLLGVLLHILRSCTYILDAQWIIPRTCGGMDYVHTAPM